MHLERGALWQAVAVAAGILLAGALLIAHLGRLEAEERRREAAELARGPAFALEQEVARSLDAVTVLAALMAEGADPHELGPVADRLLALHGTTANLQLAEGGVINHLWPLAGNEKAQGLDLANHPVHGPWVRKVREARRPMLYGPFELVQGGAAMALRAPIFVKGPAGERFWGLSSAIIRLPALVEASRLPRLAQVGLDWQLTRPAAGGGAEVLASSRADRAPIPAPVEVEVHLVDQEWRLGVAPAAGWASPGPLPLHLALALVTLLAGLLAYRTLSLPAVLRREVAARTAELAVAHREQQAALEARRQSQKLEAVGLLAGGVAHDFNNLLAAILGHADILALDAQAGGPVEEAARTISQAALRAAELTRQLLAFARLGQHRQEAVDLHALVSEATTLLGRTLDKSIRIEPHLRAARHHVLGDPGQLQQVIVNLAVNARDAMPEGGTLTLTTSNRPAGEAGLPAGAADAWLALEVSDTGHGIAPEHQERIFEPFFTTKGEGQGTGLGLATVYGIAKAHGGEVRVHSEVGRGSRFTVLLQALPEAAAAPAPPEPEPRHGSGVVLVVDDEDLVARTARRMLTSLGYQPVVAAGGPEALDWLASQPALPLVVLLDLGMPGMDGATCFRLMRERWPEVRVVLCSGFAHNARAQQLLDAGALGFLQKPYRAAELAEAMALAGPAAPPGAQGGPAR